MFDQPDRPPIDPEPSLGRPEPSLGREPSLHRRDVPVAGGPRGPSVRSMLAVALLSAIVASASTFGLASVLGLSPATTSDVPASTANAEPASVDAAEPEGLTAVVSTARDSVVTVTTEIGALDRFSPFGGSSTGVGSGLIVTSDGAILTNRHVIENATSLTVTLHDGTELPATLVEVSSTTDLALIRIEATGLTAATIGASADLEVGQTALAIGSPLGTLTESVTKGIVSALGRTITVTDELTGQPTTLKHLIQTDAAINPGHSGGPLLDATGAVIGINTATSTSAEGLGFAIPIDAATDLIDLARGQVQA